MTYIIIYIKLIHDCADYFQREQETTPQKHSTNLQPDGDEGEVCIVEFQSLHAVLNLKE